MSWHMSSPRLAWLRNVWTSTATQSARPEDIVTWQHSSGGDTFKQRGAADQSTCGQWRRYVDPHGRPFWRHAGTGQSFYEETGSPALDTWQRQKATGGTSWRHATGAMSFKVSGLNPNMSECCRWHRYQHDHSLWWLHETTSRWFFEETGTREAPEAWQRSESFEAVGGGSRGRHTSWWQGVGGMTFVVSGDDPNRSECRGWARFRDLEDCLWWHHEPTGRWFYELSGKCMPCSVFSV